MTKEELVTKIKQLQPYEVERADWTYSQWTEHWGGRYINNDPLNYYEFGSLWAVAKMMNSFGLENQKQGYNICLQDILKLIEE